MLSTPPVIALALSVMIVGSAGPAGAQTMPDSTIMTCGEARGLVVSRGAIVLRTGGQTYDRFVSSRASCEPTEVTRTSFVPTQDTPQCFVGYRCVEPSNDDWLGDR